MKTQILFLALVVSGANAQTVISPYTRCGEQRNKLMGIKGNASAECKDAIDYARKCCANGGNGCLVPSTTITPTAGSTGASKTYLAGEKALQGGLAQNRVKCYNARDQVEANCKDQSDQQAREDYGKASAGVVDCIDEESIASGKRMGPEALSGDRASARGPASEAEILNALQPKPKN